MPFYFRKSVNLGPLRFNFSKSGIGISVGVKGARLSTGPRGTYVHMGRHGFYYRQRIDTPRPPQDEQPEFSPYDFSAIETARVEELIDSSSEETLTQLNRRIRQFTFAPLFAILTLPPSVWVFSFSPQMSAIAIVTGLLCTWLIHRGDTANRTTPLFYKLEDEAAERFTAIQNAVAALNRTVCLWRVEAKKPVWDWKRNAGAGEFINRQKVKVGRLAPPFITTNVEVWGIDLGKQHLFFFPDRLFVFQGKRYGVVPYNTFQIFSTTTQFIEDHGVPRDAQIIGHTWQYVRRDGGPDRRFAHNRQIPIALYGHLELRSPTGLNIRLYVSNRTASAEFAEVFMRTQQDSFTENQSRKFTGENREHYGKRQQETYETNDAVKEKSPYETLGVQVGATVEEISTAYRQLAQQYHPDKVAHLAPEFQTLAEKRMKEINAAYTALKSGEWKTTTSEDDSDPSPYDSVAYCHEAVRSNPKDIVAHMKLGAHYFERKDYHQALPHIQAVIALAPNLAEPHLLLGASYLELGRMREALQEHRILVDIDGEKAWQLFQCIQAKESMQEKNESRSQEAVTSQQKHSEASVWFVVGSLVVGLLLLMGWIGHRNHLQSAQRAPSFTRSYTPSFLPQEQPSPPITKRLSPPETKVPSQKKPKPAVVRPKSPAISLGWYRVVRGARLMQEPRSDATPVTWLSAGTKVRVVGSVDNKWLRVESKRADRPPGYLRIEDAIREEQAEATQ